MMTSLASPIPPQLAVAEYLVQGGLDRHLRHLREALKTQHTAARSLIERFFPKGTRITEPQGGYFVWLELPPGVDALNMHRQAMAQSISTAPGVLFSADRRFTRHLRLNVGHPVGSGVRSALKLLGTCQGAKRNSRCVKGSSNHQRLHDSTHHVQHSCRRQRGSVQYVHWLLPVLLTPT